jgi:uncharacterized protein YjbI with pentapeptide repeats
MSVVDRNTRWCRLSLKDTIKAIASILIPVMIGLFTLVLAWQEHVQGQANRQNDIKIANNERTAQIRLEEFRRDQDRQLAATIQMDNVLSRFFQEMSELILENNITFTDENMRKTFVRPKILATLRQLDPARKSSIIKYLYDSMLLSGDNNSLDLSGADLSNIDLGYSFRFKGKFAERIFSTMSMHSLSLPDVRLVNASFANLYLSWSNFERSDLTGANFRGTSLHNAIFHQTNLSFTNFTDAVTALVDFEEADLTGSNLNKEQLDAAFSSYGARLPNGQQQYERINRLKNLATKECSLDKWDETYGVDIVHLPSNKHQCAFRGQTFNATLLGTLGTTGFQHLINTDKAYISLELDVQGNRKPQDFVTLPVNINLRFFASINSVGTLIDKRKLSLFTTRKKENSMNSLQLEKYFAKICYNNH